MQLEVSSCVSNGSPPLQLLCK